MLLKSKYGNTQVIVHSEREIAAYKEKGYTELKEPKPKAPKEKTEKNKE